MRARGAFADVSWKPLGVAEFLSVVRILGTAIVVDDGQPRHTLVFDTDNPDGSRIPGSIVLTERLKSRVHDWAYTRADGTGGEVVRGRVLSGEKLVNSREFSTALVTSSRTQSVAKWRVWGRTPAARRRGEILLVKSICDWADGLKNDRAQAFAAATATSLVRHILDKRDVLDSLDVPEYDAPSSSGNPAVLDAAASAGTCAVP